MSEISDSLGVFIRLYETDNSVYYVDAGAKSSIDAAVSHYLDTGRDSLLYLQTISGSELVVKASNVKAWMLSSPESRYKQLEIDAEETSTIKAFKLERGLFDD